MRLVFVRHELGNGRKGAREPVRFREEGGEWVGVGRDRLRDEIVSHVTRSVRVGRIRAHAAGRLRADRSHEQGNGDD
jgi:hypothetical protein